MGTVTHISERYMHHSAPLPKEKDVVQGSRIIINRNIASYVYQGVIDIGYFTPAQIEFRVDDSRGFAFVGGHEEVKNGRRIAHVLLGTYDPIVGSLAIQRTDSPRLLRYTFKTKEKQKSWNTLTVAKMLEGFKQKK